MDGGRGGVKVQLRCQAFGRGADSGLLCTKRKSPVPASGQSVVMELDLNESWTV